MKKSPPSEVAKKSDNPARKALKTIIDLAKKNNYGQKEPYSLQTGLREFSRDFQHDNKPFGFYKIKGEDVIFINEGVLCEEHRSLVKKVGTQSTEAPFIRVLKLGKITEMPRPDPEFVLLDNSAIGG